MEFLLKNKQVSISVVIILLVSVVLFLHFRNAENPENEAVEHLFQQSPLEGSIQEEEARVEDQTILIDVKGAVAEPGVYEMRMGDRVYQAIELAGGLLAEANQQQINLALLLQDEMVIYVPRMGEESFSNVAIRDGMLHNQDGRIAINRVDANALEQLPGIGPAKASAIISFREENGPFKDINDLLHISGIGEKSIEKLKDHLTFD